MGLTLGAALIGTGDNPAVHPAADGGSGALARGQRAQEVRSLAGVLQGAGMLQRAGG